MVFVSDDESGQKYMEWVFNNDEKHGEFKEIKINNIPNNQMGEDIVKLIKMLLEVVLTTNTFTTMTVNGLNEHSYELIKLCAPHLTTLTIKIDTGNMFGDEESKSKLTGKNARSYDCQHYETSKNCRDCLIDQSEFIEEGFKSLDKEIEKLNEIKFVELKNLHIEVNIPPNELKIHREFIVRHCFFIFNEEADWALDCPKLETITRKGNYQHIAGDKLANGKDDWFDNFNDKSKFPNLKNIVSVFEKATNICKYPYGKNRFRA